nr:hypothetical protein [Dactylococcopsis salina]
MIGTEGQGIFFIDREVGKILTQKDQEATAMSLPENGNGEAM